MSENSAIQWTDHTFNPWIGCTKVSPGCLHCYAETLMDTRYGRVKWGRGNPRSRTSGGNWKLPLKWNREAERDYLSLAHCTAAGTPIQFKRPRVFCSSLADWLDDEVPIEWLVDLLELIRVTPNLDWLLLTKRPENWDKRISAAMVFADRAIPQARDLSEAMTRPKKFTRTPLALWIAGWIEGIAPHRGMAAIPNNVWIGTTVEDQKRADERIPKLLQIPARVRFLSCEPLLEEVRIDYSAFNGADSFGSFPGIHWVICGGESGKGARPMQIKWAQSLADQCKAAGAAFFMKQLGGTRNHRGELSDFPESLRIREFPQ